MSGSFPCSVCRDQCDDHCIQCDACQRWCHFRCQNIFKNERKLWHDPSLQYVCVTCSNSDDGTFNYDRGLERLREDSLRGLKQLEAGVRREVLLLKNVTVKTSVHGDYSYQRQDPIANAIVSQYSWSALVALHSTGNGDCLFNSFSICLAGDESRATELRYRCCIEMTTNRARMLRHRLYRTLEPVSPDFDTDCLSCAQKGQYASMWNILALANFLKVKVTIIYPAVNGSETYSFKALNQKIKPPFVDPQKPTITIMWTSTRPPPRNGLGKQTGVGWEPNHFVPLVNSNRPMEKIELPEVTGDFKDVSNTAANPVNIIDNHKEVSMSVRKGSRQTSPGVQHSDCGQKSKSLTRSMEPKPISSGNTSTVAAVRKGSHMTSPGVQHSDPDHDDIISKQQSLSRQVSQQNLSCHDTPSFNREMDDVDVKSEQQESFHLEFDDVDTNSKQESFNLEFDDVDTNSKQQNPSCQESRREGDLRILPGVQHTDVNRNVRMPVKQTPLKSDSNMDGATNSL